MPDAGAAAPDDDELAAAPAVHVPTPEELAAERAAHALAARGPAFADIGVRPETVAALEAVGITHAFAIQELTLPIALQGNDLIGQARTGTGKTLGFGIPMLQRISSRDEGGSGAPQALVVVPTRELCVQVTGDLRDAGATRGIRVLAIYGGRAYEPQVEALRKGVEIVVGTPGRLLDLSQQGLLRLGEAQELVLDEADEMLDLGFLPDVERIVAQLPAERQTMLFSATMPGPIVTMARRFMKQPVHIRAELPDENRVVPQTSQHVFRAHAMDKAEMLARILQARGRGLTMVFCRTKRTAQKVADDLVDRGFAAAAVHGDLGQGAREQALRAFRSGKVDVLVATDVAARGIDVQDVTHVINYQCPEDEKVYLHRIGRTGRAGADGVAVTFVDWDEQARWGMINRALDLPFGELPETYSTSPHLFAELDIPEGTTGRLPRAQRVRAGLGAEDVEDLGETGGRRRSDAVTSRHAPGARGADKGARGSDRGARGTDRGARGADNGAGGADNGARRVDTSAPPDRPAGQPRARSRTRGAGPALAAVAADAPAADTARREGRDAGKGDRAVRSAEGGGSAEGGDPARKRRRRGGRGRGRGGAGGDGAALDAASGANGSGDGGDARAAAGDGGGSAGGPAGGVDVSAASA